MPVTNAVSQAEEEQSIELKDPVTAAILAWLVPGLGHYYQGRMAKAILFFTCIMGTFGYGVYLGMTHWGSLLDPLKDRAEAIKAAAEAFSAEQEAARAAGAPVPSGQPPTGYTSPNPGAPQEPGRGWTFAAMLAGALGGGTGLG